ncbi:MAG: pseudouridine synthase [Acholeplasmataceae bacterium]|jgi:16S rRNA pseudouridine516 synthase
MMRLDRLLANMKFGTRKEVRQMIQDGVVTVNNKIPLKTDIKVNPSHDRVVVDGEEIYYKDEIILAMYKPIGYLSANIDNLHPVVMELLKPPYHRHDFKIAGRLDLDAEGLLILTTSGNTVHLISNPHQNVIKKYEVTTDFAIDDKMLLRLLEPIKILDGNSNPYLAQALEVNKIDEKMAIIAIDQGKYHQVKRMFKAIGYEVTNLKRIKIGKYTLPNIKPGEYIEITKEDIL